MKDYTSKTKKRNTKWIILGLIGLLIIGVCSWWGATTFIESQKTYPLGDRLEYIGKRDYGCMYCDSLPTSTYYYATDMSVEEVEGYFRGARLIQKHEADSFNNYVSLYFQSDLNDDFNIAYYINSNSLPDDANVKSSNRKHVISLASSEYDIIKELLNK